MNDDWCGEWDLPEDLDSIGPEDDDHGCPSCGSASYTPGCDDPFGCGYIQGAMELASDEYDRANR